MSDDGSIKRYRAVVEWREYSIKDALDELQHGGYTVKSLAEVEELE